MNASASVSHATSQRMANSVLSPPVHPNMYVTAPWLTATSSTDGVAKGKKYPKRHHSKSRKGCFSCKSRRVKCGEENPICSSCRFRGSECCYPSPSRDTARIPASNAFHIPHGPSEDTLFSAQEMVYFYHFLTCLSHPLPLGNSSVWLKEIPQISHSHDFLLHAMLSIGVSELRRDSHGLRGNIEAFKYRGQAITGLQKALNDTSSWHNYGHVDAILSTLYILLQQSSQMPDGAQDFEVFANGCALTTSAVQEGKYRTVLNVTTSRPEEQIADAMQHLIPDTPPESAVLFVQSGLLLLASLEDAAAVSSCYPFWQALMLMSQQFCESPRQAHISSLQTFGNWYLHSPGLLSALRNTSDPLAIILTASFITDMALGKVLTQLQRWPETATGLPGPPTSAFHQVAQWIDAMYQTTSDAGRAKLTRAKIIVEMFPHPPTHTQDEEEMAYKVEIMQDLKNKAHMMLGDMLRLGSEFTTWFEETLIAKYRAQKMEFE